MNVQEIHSSPLAVVGIAEFTLNLLRQLLCSKQIDTAPVIIIILIILQPPIQQCEEFSNLDLLGGANR